MKKILLCLAAVLLLFGCNRDYNMRSRVPQRILAVADWHIDTLRHGDMVANKKYLSPNMQTPQEQARLEKLSKLLQSDDLMSMGGYEVVFFELHGIMDGTRYNLTYQLQFKDYWLLVHMTVDSLGQWRGIVKTTFQPLHKPIQELNAFNFENKSWQHYTVLGTAIAIILFVGYAIWKWAHIKMPWGWKAFWFIVIFISFGRFIFDWNYNRYAMQWMTVRGIPVFVNKRAHNGWWYFTLSFPAGACVFLYLDRQWRRAERKPDDEESED